MATGGKILQRPEKRSKVNCLQPNEQRSHPFKVSEKTYKDVCIYRQPSATSRAIGYGTNRKTGVIKDFYTKQVIRKASQEKFRKLWLFGKQIERIRSNYMRMVKSSNEREQLYGVIMYLMDHLALRPGSKQHKKRYGTIGASTLEKHHILKDSNECIVFEFPGKLHRKTKKLNRSGPLCNKQIVRAIKGLIKTNRYFLADSVKMNFSDLLPKGITAKFFRTWRANVLFLQYILNNVPRHRERKIKRSTTVSKAIEYVSHRLHHTPQVCKQKYIHPHLLYFAERYGVSKADTLFEDYNANPYEFKTEAEKLLMKILEEKYSTKKE